MPGEAAVRKSSVAPDRQLGSIGKQPCGWCTPSDKPIQHVEHHLLAFIGHERAHVSEVGHEGLGSVAFDDPFVNKPDE